MKKIPFINIFSQSAIGLSVCGNDLIVTTIYKKTGKIFA